MRPYNSVQISIRCKVLMYTMYITLNSMYINMIFMFLINGLLYDNLRVCVYDIFANATAFRR